MSHGGPPMTLDEIAAAERPASQHPQDYLRDLIHEAMRRASEKGCCNLPSCAFEGGYESMLCDELVEALETARSRTGRGR